MNYKKFLIDAGLRMIKSGLTVETWGNHDEGTGVPVNPIAAALILADKSDVRRSRVRNQDTSKFDIHDRVNYSVTKAELKINESKTLIKLKLHIDTRYGSVMDYFEIFLNRILLYHIRKWREAHFTNKKMPLYREAFSFDHYSSTVLVMICLPL